MARRTPKSPSTTILLSIRRSTLPTWVQTRRFHSNYFHEASVTTQSEPIPSITNNCNSRPQQPPPLAILPTSQIIRSYLITRTTSSPLLLTACFAILKRMLDPKAVLLSPQRNPLLKFVFKHTFYQQFCAGENRREVQKTIKSVKDAGYTGVILEYALEVLAGEGGKDTAAKDLQIWHDGMMESVQMCSSGDFVGLKWSGIGSEALKLLNAGQSPTKEMYKSIVKVCDLAASTNVALLPGAELEITNTGIDQWTIGLQRLYNKKQGHAIIYTTYQAYLKSTPSRIARDLAIAQKEGFTLGIKLVRGAYLVSEPKTAVVDSKEATDEAYDNLVSALLTRRYNSVLRPSNPQNTVFPQVSLMIASHNADSVKKARKIRKAQAAAGEPLIELAYAQLQGMADEISCSLVAASREAAAETDKSPIAKDNARLEDAIRPFKCATWGTVEQCLNFLYRRAYENQDAASRTVETRRAMGQELWRRAKAVFERR